MNIQFEISTDNILGFSEIISENELENTIVGTTDNGNLLIDVFYSRENRDAIEDLENLAENE